MRASRAILTALAVGLIMPVAGGAASADVEWCDSGSPPPNDFRFRMTGAPSATSSTSWLSSTTDGELDTSAGDDMAATLEGGVARGMWTAIANAPSAETTQVRNVDDEDDEGDADDDEDGDEEDEDD